MKSLFSRLRRDNNSASGSTSRAASSSSTSASRHDALSDVKSAVTSHADPSVQQRHPSETYLAPPRPPTPLVSLSPSSPSASASSSSSASTRPRSTFDDGHELVAEACEESPLLEVHGRQRAVSGAEAVKKVTFRSPVPTPTASVVLDEIPSLLSDMAVGGAASTSTHQPTRSSSTSPTKRAHDQHLHPVLASRPNSRNSFLHNPFATRKTPVPSPISVSPTKSALSPTPSDSSAMSSACSYLPAQHSWSEMAEEELVANLAPKERTRQEVLWEIVSSEERYVAELIKLNDTFARALLPPSASSPSLNLFDPSNTLSQTLSPSGFSSPTSPTDSFDHLPIAAQYSKVTHGSSPSLHSTIGNAPPPPAPNPRMNAYNVLTNGRPAAGPGPANPAKKPSMTTLSGRARSHQSLPPLPRNSSQAGSYLSGKSNRFSFQHGRRSDSRVNSSGSMASLTARDVQVPDDLEKILSALSGGILEGHLKLAAALRKRYENQYPLVRSLADVFNAHAYLFKEYSTYVLHLERALEAIDHALALVLSKRISRSSPESPAVRFGRLLCYLEELAAERGESGLSISLAKPFQRLLKYPLLFQNLLFNTDPSLKEYEATLGMVDQVEEIVRSIEDEKASSEERERTRDVWARIEGLENDKVLMAPKPNRLLVSETQVQTFEGQRKDDTTKKKSLKRLSDILKGSPDTDSWIVRFSDVSLLCVRTGITHLPISGTKGKISKSESTGDLGGRRGHGARRAQSIKARNLYRFVKVQEWNLTPNAGQSEGLVSMADISRSRSRPGRDISTLVEPLPVSLPSPETPRKISMVPLKTDDGPTPTKDDSTPRSSRLRVDADTETLVSENMSVMSFAFKGSDQIRPIRAHPKPSPTKLGGAGAGAAGAGGASVDRTRHVGRGLQRRSSAGHVSGHAANAKFAHRLRAADTENNQTYHAGDGNATVRPTSRARQSLPPAMAARPFTTPVPPTMSGLDKGGRSANASSGLSIADGNASSGLSNAERNAPTGLSNAERNANAPSPSARTSSRNRVKARGQAQARPPSRIGVGRGAPLPPKSNLILNPAPNPTLSRHRTLVSSDNNLDPSRHTLSPTPRAQGVANSNTKATASGGRGDAGPDGRKKGGDGSAREAQTSEDHVEGLWMAYRDAGEATARNGVSRARKGGVV